MVNSKSNIPGSSGVSNSSTSGGSTAGVGSTSGGSSAGGGSAPGATPPAGNLPPATTQPRHGFRSEVATIVAALVNIPAGSTVMVAGQSLTKTGILAVYQPLLDLFAEIDAGVQSLKSQRLALQAALPAAHQFTVNLRAGLVALFGKGNPVLESFGFSGTKPHKLTVEQKTARKAKAAETRALRGTGGKRQKAAVKYTGQIEVQTVKSGAPAAGGSPSPTGSSQAGAGSTPSGGDTGAGTPAAK